VHPEKFLRIGPGRQLAVHRHWWYNVVVRTLNVRVCNCISRRCRQKLLLLLLTLSLCMCVCVCVCAISAFEERRTAALVAKRKARKDAVAATGTMMWTCDVCGRPCASRIGLFAHRKSHR